MQLNDLRMIYMYLLGVSQNYCVSKYCILFFNSIYYPSRIRKKLYSSVTAWTGIKGVDKFWFLNGAVIPAAGKSGKMQEIGEAWAETILLYYLLVLEANCIIC